MLASTARESTGREGNPGQGNYTQDGLNAAFRLKNKAMIGWKLQHCPSGTRFLNG